MGATDRLQSERLLGDPAPRRGGVPIYLRVVELVMRDVAAGRLVDGARLPPERAMAAELGIAVGTLRKALDDLAGRGLVERIHGSGNYIRTGTLRDQFYPMFRIELIAGGGMPTVETLGIAVLDKPADLPEFGASRRASRVRRLRFLDGQPVAVEEIWLDGTMGEVGADGLEMSLYDYYRSRLNFWIEAAEDRVSFAPVPDWAPAGFGLRPGQTAGYVERLGWADRPAPVEFSRSWFDPARAVYVQRMR